MRTHPLAVVGDRRGRLHDRLARGMSVLSDFLAGRPPRPNGPTLAERYQAVARDPLAHDVDRVAAVRAVAERRGMDLARYFCDGQASDAYALRLRAEAAEFGEALAVEGLLPAEWAHPDAISWVGWIHRALFRNARGGEVRCGATSPHEVATLAAWAPAVEAARAHHDTLVSEARAWGAVVGGEFNLTTEAAESFGPPFDLDGLFAANSQMLWGDTRLRFPAELAATEAIVDSFGEGATAPPWVTDYGPFVEDDLGLRFPEEIDYFAAVDDDARAAPETGTLLEKFSLALRAERLLAEAGRRGLVVPQEHSFRRRSRGTVRGQPSVCGRPFASLSHPIETLLALYESGVPVLEAKDTGVVYFLRGMPDSPPRRLAAAGPGGASSTR